MLQHHLGYVNMVATDYDPYALSLAMVAHEHPCFFAHAFPNDFVKYDMCIQNEKLVYDTGYFDIVTLSYVLHPLKPQEIVKLLTEIRRVMRSNGTLLVMQRSRDETKWIYEWMKSSGFENVKESCSCDNHCFITAKKRHSVKTKRICFLS